MPSDILTLQLGHARTVVRRSSALIRPLDASISLRFGEGTSAAAMSIYRSLGFAPRADNRLDENR